MLIIGHRLTLTEATNIHSMHCFHYSAGDGQAGCVKLKINILDGVGEHAIWPGHVDAIDHGKYMTNARMSH